MEISCARSPIVAALGLLLLAGCGGGDSTTPPPSVSVSISPSSVTVGALGTQSFTATVANATSSAVNWSASAGTIVSAGNTGMYTAPLAGGNYTVTATSVEDGTKSASASVTVTPVNVSVAPNPAVLFRGEPTVFTATVTGTAQVLVTGAAGVTAADDADDGACTWDHCSLREAINEANADVDADTIFLSPDAAPSPARARGPTRSEGPALITTVLTGALPTITGDLTIVGEGSTESIIDADASLADMRRVLHIDGAMVMLQGLTVQGGVSAGDGGGILVDGGGYLIAEDVAVVDNETRNAFGGGIGITGAGSMARLQNTEVSNNRTFGVSRPGAGIQVASDAALYVTDGQIRGNVVGDGWGAGVWGFDFAAIEIVNTDIEDNTVLVGFGGGGGILAELPLNPAAISRQAAGGGTVTISGSTISGNSTPGGGGGGRLLNGVVASIDNSTITGNSAANGGGLELGSADATIDNSNIDDNTATSHGGGFLMYGDASVVMTGGTVNGNTSGPNGGGGFYMQAATSVHADGSIINGNQTGGGGGGAAVFQYAKCTLMNGSIDDNVAGFGGGAYMAGPPGPSSSPSSIEGTPFDGPAPVPPNPTGSSPTPAMVAARQVGPTPPEINVISSTVDNNQATTFDAGGLCALGGTLTVTNSVVSNNQAAGKAGGVNAEFGAVVNVTGSDIIDNTAAGPGGGLWLEPGTTVLDQLFISGNTTGVNGGGLSALQNVTLSNSTVSDNTAVNIGGGVVGGFTGPFTVSNSTISGNTAADGGGFGGFGPATLTNVTITGNSATTQGGGARIQNAVGLVTLTNTLFSANPGPAGDQNCFVVGAGTFLSGGGNLSDDATCGALTLPTDQTSTPAGLDPILADNGGPTLTHALLPGSAAIDAGVAGGPAADQRGSDRDAMPDVGAYEADATPPPNQDPVANIVANPTSVGAGDNNQTVVTLNGLGSSDPDGDALTYAWTVPSGTFVMGTTNTDSVIQVTFPGSGDYTITLTVDDGRGGSNTAQLIVPLS